MHAASAHPIEDKMHFGNLSLSCLLVLLPAALFKLLARECQLKTASMHCMAVRTDPRWPGGCWRTPREEAVCFTLGGGQRPASHCMAEGREALCFTSPSAGGNALPRAKCTPVFHGTLSGFSRQPIAPSTAKKHFEWQAWMDHSMSPEGMPCLQ